ncbi:MAG: FAD-binding oxidoreductase, partial [Sphingobacteriales bacterium]|nr:FAD-binding oxidoreductase [Sphingobacteriales bacterium]
MMKVNSHLNDASIFELASSVLNVPQSQSELYFQLKYDLDQHLPITLRAGGTSLGGQAIGSGVVIDVSRHLTHILDYRPDEFEVDV